MNAKRRSWSDEKLELELAEQGLPWKFQSGVEPSRKSDEPITVTATWAASEVTRSGIE
jgi:hypothetical protein